MLILCLFYAWGPRITATCAGGSLRDSAVSKVVPVAFSDAGRVSVIYVASTRLHIGTTAISSLFFLLLSFLLVSRALLYFSYSSLLFFSYLFPPLSFQLGFTEVFYSTVPFSSFQLFCFSSPFHPCCSLVMKTAHFVAEENLVPSRPTCLFVRI